MKVAQYVKLIAAGNPSHPQLREVFKQGWKNFKEVLKFFKAQNILRLGGSQINPRFKTPLLKLSDDFEVLSCAELIEAASYYTSVSVDEGVCTPFAQNILCSDHGDYRRAAVLFGKFAKAYTRSWLDFNAFLGRYVQGNDSNQMKHDLNRFVSVIKLFEEVMFFHQTNTWNNLLEGAAAGHEACCKTLTELIHHHLFQGETIELLPQEFFQSQQYETRKDWRFLFDFRVFSKIGEADQSDVRWSCPFALLGFLSGFIDDIKMVRLGKMLPLYEMMCKYSTFANTIQAEMERMWYEIENESIRTIHPQTWVKVSIPQLNSSADAQCSQITFHSQDFPFVDAHISVKLMGQTGIYSIPLQKGKYLSVESENPMAYFPVFLQYMCMVSYHALRVGEGRSKLKDLGVRRKHPGGCLDGIAVGALLRRLSCGKASAQAQELMKNDPEFKGKSIPEGWTYQRGYTFGAGNGNGPEDLRTHPKLVITAESLGV